MTKANGMTCSVDGCLGSKSRIRKGYCCMHYCRLWRNGDLFISHRNNGIGNTAEERFWSRVDKNGPTQSHMTTACWVWTGCKDKKGYGVVEINKEKFSAHNAAFFFVKGYRIINSGLHHCDFPSCVNPDHVYDGTPADNARDRVIRGRVPRGSNHSISKLTEDNVAVIKKRLRAGEPPKIIADDFPISSRLISFINCNKIWRHVPWV